MTTVLRGQHEVTGLTLATSDQIGVDRGENEGMIGRSHDLDVPDGQNTKVEAATDTTVDGWSAPADHQGRRGGQLPVEDTDLERRVLAHERILQALIAHMAETEPRFVERLRATFSDAEQLQRAEHDYVDTESYAEQFIKGVVRLGSAVAKVEPALPGPLRLAELPGTVSSVDAPSGSRKRDNFEVTARTGVWSVVKNGRFFGDFLSRSDAQSAINAALPKSVAKGRVVAVSWPQSEDGAS